MTGALKALAVQLLRRRLPFTSAEMSNLISALLQIPPTVWPRTIPWQHTFPLGSLVRQVEGLVKEQDLSPELRPAIEGLVSALNENYAEERQVIRRLSALLTESPELVAPGEPWSDALLHAWSQMPPGPRSHWQRLFQHALTANSRQPSARWLKNARELLQPPISPQDFAQALCTWLAPLPKRAARPMPDSSASLLKGLVWIASLVENPDLAHTLGDAALACFQKIPEVGARAQKAGNACIYALSAMPGQTAVSELSRLQHKLRYAAPVIW
ncbi:MAG: hypothetical protein AB1894_15485 [Chloroflexota bacterium]